MACALKFAPSTKRSKQPFQPLSTEKASANVIVTGSGRQKETWAEKNKRQKEEKRAISTADPGNIKAGASGNSSDGGGGGTAKGNSGGTGSGGKKGKMAV
ncbi:hypothetical protein HK097_009326 [Rhizophlyctis rosea]|uniref:Uncharacterized protein n=1 Tax=Rhizophlyctis rosea TaxID=64517 RepID=A0AAD5SHB4_9FUNG|nr:hypothetical protein HK097_009326 [Rhizophlyctis rosea]